MEVGDHSTESKRQLLRLENGPTLGGISRGFSNLE